MNADVSLQMDAILLHLDEAELVRSFTQAELILAEHNIDIEVDSLEEYADVLIEMSESDEGFSLDEKDFFGKVGKLVRTVAHQIGKAQGKVKRSEGPLGGVQELRGCGQSERVRPGSRLDGHGPDREEHSEGHPPQGLEAAGPAAVFQGQEPRSQSRRQVHPQGRHSLAEG